MATMAAMQKEIYDAFIEAGVSESRAKAAAEVMTEYRKTDEVATKADIADLRADFMVGIANLETRLTRFILVTNGIVIGLVVGLIKII